MMALYYVLMLCVGSFLSEVHLRNFVPFGDYIYMSPFDELSIQLIICFCCCEVFLSLRISLPLLKYKGLELISAR
jgi:hypothetical protein